MIKLFSGNNPFSIILLFFLGILLRLPQFSGLPIPAAVPEDGKLYQHFLNTCFIAFGYLPGWHQILAYLLVFIQALILNGLVNNQKLFTQPTYLTAFCYLLIGSFFPEWSMLSPALLINTFMVWTWAKMTTLTLQQRPKSVAFNISFGIGICSFVYFETIYFMLLLWVAFFMFRPFQLTEWLVSIIGLLTPYYFLAVYLFVCGNWQDFFSWIPPQQIKLPVFTLSIHTWVAMLLLLIPLLGGWFMSMRYMPRLVVQLRKSWSLMLFYLVIALFIPIIHSGGGLQPWMLALVPVSIFHSAFYWHPHSKHIVGAVAWLSMGWVLLNYAFLSP